MKLKLLDGQGPFYTTETDLKICIINNYINDVALKKFKDETGLTLKKLANHGGYWTTPINPMQVVNLLTHANSFEVYYSNNTLFLKIRNYKDLVQFISDL